MKRLSIGIDIDGVIVDYASAMLPLLSQVCRRPVLLQDLRYWDLRKALDIDDDELAYVWEQTLGTDMVRHAPPIEGAIAGLSALRRHEIWLVSARPSSMLGLTLSWLADHGVGYDHLVLDRQGDKLSAGRGFDVFVEDYLEEARILAEAGVFTILMDQPWNQEPVLPQNCTRVADWRSILALVRRFEEE